MKNIKTISVLLLFLTLIGTSILNGASRKPFIIRRDKKRIEVDSLTADEKGNIKYKIRSMTAGMKPSQYIYAHVTMPREILEARRLYNSKKYSDAEKAFDTAYKKYKYLGWGSVCIYYSAKSLEARGKTEEAAAKSDLLKEAPKDPEEIPYFMKAKQVQADILIKAEKYEDAKKVLNYISKSNDEESAMFANNAKGDILYNQDKKSEALFMYLRNIILFDPNKKTTESTKSIEKAAEILKAQGHPRAEEFEKMK